MDVFQAGLAFGTQTANTVYAGPTSGSAAAPAFRAVVSADLPVGTLVQRVYAEYTTNADLGTAIPADDTLPQKTEGIQVLTASITPKNTTNRVRARFLGWGACDGTVGQILCAALFVNTGADAVQAGMTHSIGGLDEFICLEYESVPGSTSSQTYAIRVGPNAAGTARLNGTAAARYFGGASRATLVLEELAA